MPITFAIGFGLCIAFAILAITISVIASQCMSAIQGSAIDDMLKNAIATTRPSRFIPSFEKDGGPSDTRVWLALRGADYLPETVRRKAKVISLLYETARLVHISLFAIIMIAVVRYRR